MRKEYEMSESQFEDLMDAFKPVPLIALNCGMPPSPQENANRAWAELGKEMGFDGMTVKPVSGKGPRFFTAEPVKGKEPYIDIVFDGPPGPEAGRFVEAEDENGKGISVGIWLERPDGYWALRIKKEKLSQDQP